MKRPALALALAVMTTGTGASAQGVVLDEAPERGTRLPGRGSDEDRLASEEEPVRRIPWTEDRPIPDGFELHRGRRWGLVVGGAATFGFAYLTGVVMAVLDVRLTEQDVEDEVSSGRNDPLYAPLIGPFVALGTEDRTGGESALLVVAGMIQSGGVALAMAGLLTREHWLERVRVGVGPTGGHLSVAW
ncbi:MAG: hypothetical protein RIF41_20425 [Polyangiaceae bacterium]